MTELFVLDDFVLLDGTGAAPLPSARVVVEDGPVSSPDAGSGCFSEQQLLLNWRAYLRSGVTSVVSVGNDKNLVLAARAAEREGTLTSSC